MQIVLLVLAGLVVAGLLLMVLELVIGPVSRRRLERFARRQRLSMTVDNGHQVIRYLATTRRWRVAGFLGGLVAAQPFTAEGTIVEFNFIAMFAGWFLGALIAEIRVEHLAHGPIRVASLQPRRPDRYVRRFAWALVPVAAVVAVTTGAGTVAAGRLGWADPNWAHAGTWLALAIATAVTVRLIQRAVLRRAQPAAAPDVIAADDAIRSRSLHVLSGGGAALVLFMTLNLLSAVHPRGAGAQAAIAAIVVIGVFGVALLGWLVATSMWPPPGSAPGPNRPALSAA